MINTPLFLFCNKDEEMPWHIFREFTFVTYLWQQLTTLFENSLILAALTPRLAWAHDA